MFSAALCRGLIEASRSPRASSHEWRGFPRLYAAASLKQGGQPWGVCVQWAFSAALCRGLIEADVGFVWWHQRHDVFRGSMPRPH